MKDTVKTPISYYGGKQRMAKHILPLIPPHKLYCEPFFGGGAIFFLKPKSEVEVINDLNDDVINFFRTCQNDFGVLRMLIVGTAHSRKVHREAAIIMQNPDAFSSIKRAWAFWVQTNMSFTSKILGGFAYARKSNSDSKKISNKRLKFTRQILDRISLTQIECNDALQVIKSRDFEGAFFYIDPPYFNSDCGHYGGYTEADFRKLLELLATIKGKFLLSSYPSAVLDEFMLRYGWNQKSTSQKISVTHKVDRLKTEVLTANYDISGLADIISHKPKRILTTV